MSDQDERESLTFDSESDSEPSSPIPNNPFEDDEVDEDSLDEEAQSPPRKRSSIRRSPPKSGIKKPTKSKQKRAGKKADVTEVINLIKNVQVVPVEMTVRMDPIGMSLSKGRFEDIHVKITSLVADLNRPANLLQIARDIHLASVYLVYRMQGKSSIQNYISTNKYSDLKEAEGVTSFLSSLDKTIFKKKGLQQIRSGLMVIILNAILDDSTDLDQFNWKYIPSNYNQKTLASIYITFFGDLDKIVRRVADRVLPQRFKKNYRDLIQSNRNKFVDVIKRLNN